jgi:hypothetical protein
MRILFPVAAALLAPALAVAQPPVSYWNTNVGDLGYKAAFLTPSAAQKLALDGSVTAFNWQVDQLKDDRELWLGRYQIYDNVISLRGKDAVMAWVDEARKKLGVSELEGYRLLGQSNVYDQQSYVRYYDNQGNLVMAEIRATYDELLKKKAEFDASVNRLHGEAAAISANYQAVLDSYRAERDALLAEAARQEALAAAYWQQQTAGIGYGQDFVGGPRYGSGGPQSFSYGGRSGGSGSGYARYQAFQNQSNALINSINNRSAAFRSNSMNSLNNYGNQLRNPTGGSGGGGGQRIFYDENAPRRPR